MFSNEGKEKDLPDLVRTVGIQVRRLSKCSALESIVQAW